MHQQMRGRPPNQNNRIPPPQVKKDELGDLLRDVEHFFKSQGFYKFFFCFQKKSFIRRNRNSKEKSEFLVEGSIKLRVLFSEFWQNVGLISLRLLRVIF